MINITRFGFFVLAALVITAPGFCQDEPVKPVDERLDEVRASIDEAYSNIATLQQHLNNATDAKDDSRIEKLREEIDFVWTEIERLKELEDMLQDLKAREDAVSNDRPRRAVGGAARGRGGFNNDTSSGGQGARNNGFIMEDGTTGDPFRGDTSTGERPRRALPGAEKENELAPANPRPGRKERPQRATGVGQPSATGQPAPPLTSKKLRQLEASYEALILAGETSLAEKVLKSIEIEKKRLAKEAKEQAEEEAKNNREPRSGQQPGRSSGGGLAGTEPARGPTGKSQEELIKELENLIKQLQDENRELREKKDNDK